MNSAGEKPPDPSRHRHDPRHLGHLLPQVPLNAVLQRHRAARAPVTRPVKPNLHQPVRPHVHQLNVPAVGLYGGADEVDHGLHTVAQRRTRRPV